MASRKWFLNAVSCFLRVARTPTLRDSARQHWQTDASEERRRWFESQERYRLTSQQSFSKAGGRSSTEVDYPPRCPTGRACAFGHVPTLSRNWLTSVSIDIGSRISPAPGACNPVGLMRSRRCGGV
jgi:hypothetical protein